MTFEPAHKAARRSLELALGEARCRIAELERIGTNSDALSVVIWAGNETAKVERQIAKLEQMLMGMPE